MRLSCHSHRKVAGGNAGGGRAGAPGNLDWESRYWVAVRAGGQSRSIALAAYVSSLEPPRARDDAAGAIIPLSASSPQRDDAGIVLESLRILDVRLEVGEGPWIGKAGAAQQLEVAANREASRLIVPRRCVRLDEVAIDEHA